MKGANESAQLRALAPSRGRIGPSGRAELGEREIPLLVAQPMRIGAQRERWVLVAEHIGDPANALAGRERERRPRVTRRVQLETWAKPIALSRS